MATLRDVLLYQAMHEDNPPSDEDYPTWVCTECAEAAGGKMPVDHLATWHYDKCDVCGGEKKTVTQPRDFGYPKFAKTAQK